MKILDCTLRDGGYYNNWHFDKKTVLNYLNSMKKCGVDIIEMGLRSIETSKFLGPYAYTPDSLLKSLPLPSEVEIAVMINAKEYIDNGTPNINVLKSKFKSAKSSPVDIVRIASHFNECNLLPQLIQNLNDLGYKVIVNLMQSGDKSKDDFEEAINYLKSSPIEALYFADSLGNMNESKVNQIIKYFKEMWGSKIGFHAHNNMSNALSNCRECINHDLEYIDGTVLGMGRGAGNVPTEYLLRLASEKSDKYKAEALFPLILNDFNKLQMKYQWGPSLMYYISAEYNIHPTYIQELLSNKNNKTSDIINTLNNLKKEKQSSSFSTDKLQNATKVAYTSSKGVWNPTELIADKDILIIGSGPSTTKHYDAIISYIDEIKPFVICLNINNQIPSEYIDIYSASHHLKILTNLDHYCNLKKPLMIPYMSLNESMQNKLESLKILDYGLEITEDLFEANKYHASTPYPLVFAYTIAACNAGQAKSISVVGLDGYENGNQRQIEMQNLLKLYRRKDYLNITSLTNTTYNISQSSIYNI